MAIGKALVVVESPAKARTISRILNDGTEVLASMGHVRDLPETSLGVDVHNGYQPHYVVTRNGKRVVRSLKEAARDVDAIILATDPDREGEAIAWHILELLKDSTSATFHRVTFHEITAEAVRAAFADPGILDLRKIDAQQARRVLDRLVGYQVSPLLWKHIRKGTSAGRVQSVALRLVCEREHAIQKFVPVEYWEMEATFLPQAGRDTFTARLAMLDGAKPAIPDAETAGLMAKELESADFKIAKVAKTPRQLRPSAPFITSTLQQAAGNRLRMTTRQTMRNAQQLYEGVDLGDQGAVGLITYMRTDSVTVAKEAQEKARVFIGETFGADYVPAKPNVFRSSKGAQEAHEAIRPTEIRRTPDEMAPFLGPSQQRLYRLIWNRFVASQMAPAKLLEHAIEVEPQERSGLAHEYVFRASVTSVVFPGFQQVDKGGSGEDDGDEDQTKQARDLPEVKAGQPCDLSELAKTQRFTEPPRRYTEAALVRELEQNGVGRPSTYATIVNTIQDRDYAKKERRHLVPTPLGFSVSDYLLSRLPKLFDVDFTARMEAQLDKVEEGQSDWTGMLGTFYEEFREWVDDLPLTSLPSPERTAKLLGVFPESIQWAPPTKRGGRSYDDGKFFASIAEQVQEKGKALSEKQWMAVLRLAARYADQIPQLREVACETGVEAIIDDFIEKETAKSEEQEGTAQADPVTERLVAALEKVEWEPPRKQGRRRFDDRRFYESLSEQAHGGKALSSAQMRSLKRLAAKYRDQIAGYEELAQAAAIEGEEETPPEGNEHAGPLVELLDSISEWQPPVKRGGRTYDDRTFAMSVKEQHERRGALSERQIGALRRLLARYAKQIDGYESKTKELGLVTPKAKPEPVDANCPTCGAQLVSRAGRSRRFYGCSAFPKCRFTASSLPSKAEEAS